MRRFEEAFLWGERGRVRNEELGMRILGQKSGRLSKGGSFGLLVLRMVRPPGRAWGRGGRTPPGGRGRPRFHRGPRGHALLWR